MLKRLFRWAKGLNDKIKFVLVGCLNTAISTAVYLTIMACIGYGPFEKNPDAPFLLLFLATLAGQLLGLVNSYFWNKFFTFQQGKRDGWELVRFVGVYAVSYLVDYGMKFGLRQWFDLREIWIVLIVLCFTTVISYLGQRYLVFRKKPDTQEKEDHT